MFELVLRVIVSMALVLGLLWVAGKVASRRVGAPSRSLVRVLGRQPIARSASVAVVEVGTQVLVLGVSEHGVSLLTEMDPTDLPDQSPSPGGIAASVPLPGSWLRRPPVAGVLSRATSQGGLNGSVLSQTTWRQAWSAATSRNGGTPR